MPQRGRITIEFGEEQFSFNPLLPFLSGVAIAVLSSALGVGGGFLLVPFMSIVMGLPMFISRWYGSVGCCNSFPDINQLITYGWVLSWIILCLALLMLGVAVVHWQDPI